MAFGTVFTLDTLSNTQSETVQEIGEERIWNNVDGFFAAHNALFNQAMAMVAERTTDRMRNYGGVDEIEVQELDEFGQPSAQKPTVPGYNVGFPLRRFGSALQWTRFAFENMSVKEFQNKIDSITDGDEQNLYAALRRALFGPTNTTFMDWQQMPRLQLPVKALLNGDGELIPAGPTGVTFDGATHTHYLGVATANTPTQGEVEGAIEHNVEHFTTGGVILSINRAQEATVNGFADFREYRDVRLMDQRNELVATGTLNMSNIYDRAIGLLNGAEVWVRPWVPAGYMLAHNPSQPAPLVVRQPIPQTARDLRLVAENENYPLRATEWEHRFGVAVWNRANGVALDVATGGGTYTAPAL